MRIAPPVRTLVERAAVIWGVRRADITGRGRLAEHCEPRFAVYWCAHEAFNYSTLRIGRILGRDHSTIISGLARYKKLRMEYRFYRKQSDELWEFAQELKGVK